jgi:hypothetical protein
MAFGKHCGLRVEQFEYFVNFARGFIVVHNRNAGFHKHFKPLTYGLYVVINTALFTQHHHSLVYSINKTVLKTNENKTIEGRILLMKDKPIIFMIFVDLIATKKPSLHLFLRTVKEKNELGFNAGLQKNLSQVKYTSLVTSWTVRLF